MTKSGLNHHIQWQVVNIVQRYAAQERRCGIAQIYTSLYPGHVYDPRLSSLRVTLSWLVRQGMLRRQRHGRSSSFYPVSTREEHDEDTHLIITTLEEESKRLGWAGPSFSLCP